MTGILTEEALFKKSPQEITTLLYEVSIDSLEEAIDAINDKAYDIANQKLTKVNDILYRLGAGINYEAGIIADQLEALYDYMANKLIEANLKKDIKVIEEVVNILQAISTSWNEALKKGATPQNSKFRKSSSAYEQNILTKDFK
ncbi:flagellar export chaperone FliS [Schinkia sp. CFF1]